MSLLSLTLLRLTLTLLSLTLLFLTLLSLTAGLDHTTLPKQGDRSQWGALKQQFGAVFRTKTRDEWGEIFYGTDACVVPILNPHEAALNEHNQLRGTYGPTPEQPGAWEPNPAPKLSRTPGHLPRPLPIPGAHTKQVLQEFGIESDRIDQLFKSGVVVGETKQTTTPIIAKL